MSRFSVIRSKGKFYVVAKDTNTLAGGPFLSPLRLATCLR